MLILDVVQRKIVVLPHLTFIGIDSKYRVLLKFGNGIFIPVWLRFQLQELTFYFQQLPRLETVNKASMHSFEYVSRFLDDNL
jgi:hypothetical protein